MLHILFLLQLSVRPFQLNLIQLTPLLESGSNDDHALLNDNHCMNYFDHSDLTGMYGTITLILCMSSH
jgi:hypothetical protein